VYSLTTTTLSALNLLLCVDFALVVLAFMEVLKAVERRRQGLGGHSENLGR
jgi:hypothetical protein